MKILQLIQKESMMKFKSLFIFFLCTILPLNTIYSQYQIGITNAKIVNEKVFEFDVFVKSLENSFILTSYQCALSCNNYSINGGQLSFSYISSTSTLKNPPSNSIGIQKENDLQKLCFASNVGNDTVYTSYKKIGTFRLQNTNAFVYDSLDIKWIFTGNIRTLVTNDSYVDITLPENFNGLVDPSPTPVEAVILSSDIKDNTVRINWTSITELNLDRYEIERKSISANKESDWKSVGSINATSTSSSTSKYNFTDKAPNLNGKYKYRLKIIDLDGSYSFSDEIEVNIKKSLSYSLQQNYPNPFNPSTTIRYSLPFASEVKIIIYNTLGQQVSSLVNEIQGEGEYEKTLNATGLPSGNYFYVLNAKSTIDGQEFRDVKKMIVLK